MKITIDEINTYRKIGDKIEILAKAFYDEFIYCNRTYEYLGWELLENNEIRIDYSFIDYHELEGNTKVYGTIKYLDNGKKVCAIYSYKPR